VTEYIVLRNRARQIVGVTGVDPEDFARFGHLGWFLHRSGYVVRAATRAERAIGAPIQISLHREVLGQPWRRERGAVVDHADRNKLNNRRNNLRVVTLAQNAHNQGPLPGASSAYRGVCWHARDQRWQASVKIGAKNHHLGYFDSEIAAARAARDFRLANMPTSTEVAL
jgi:hypothetical protein